MGITAYSSIGRLYGVSGAAIKKRARILGIQLPIRRVINESEHFNKGTSKSLIYKSSDEEFKRIIEESTTWQEIFEKLGYSGKNQNSRQKNIVVERCKKLGIEANIHLKKSTSSILDKTKGELFRTMKNWQAARSSIVKNARSVFYSYNTEQKCAICGYDKHIEVAHIIPVRSFGDDASIREINSIDNLIGLCPNHHWEYDNGLLIL